jgi:uncharacterized RDD family membrane protein YckC
MAKKAWNQLAEPDAFRLDSRRQSQHTILSFMQYFIGKNGQQLGPFGEEQIRARLASGEFSNSDLMWREGMAAWEPIGQVLGNPYLPTAHLGASPMFSAQRPLADLGARLAAALLDTLCMLAAAIPLIISAALSDRSGSSSTAQGMMALGAILILGFSIYQVVILSKQGQTLGKKMMKIRIVNFNGGGNPGFGKAAIMRGFLPALITQIPFFGLIFYVVDICFIFRADRRCIHDLMANTHVVEA